MTYHEASARPDADIGKAPELAMRAFGSRLHEIDQTHSDMDLTQPLAAFPVRDRLLRNSEATRKAPLAETEPISQSSDLSSQGRQFHR